MPRIGVYAAAGLASLALAGCGGLSRPVGSGPAGTGSSVLDELDVKLPPPARLQSATPKLELRDSTGHRTTLAQFKGKAVVLTFIYTHCPDVCPLLVANLHTALTQLGSKAKALQIIAVSVDPRGDTPRAVRAFLRAHEMTGRMRYLVGSFRQLAPVWRAWGVEVQASPDRREQTVGHSAFLYGITGAGRPVVLYPPTFDPSWLVHDVPILAAH
jgi:protein SCO1/2